MPEIESEGQVISSHQEREVLLKCSFWNLIKGHWHLGVVPTPLVKENLLKKRQKH